MAISQVKDKRKTWGGNLPRASEWMTTVKYTEVVVKTKKNLIVEIPLSYGRNVQGKVMICEAFASQFSNDRLRGRYSKAFVSHFQTNISIAIVVICG